MLRVEVGSLCPIVPQVVVRCIEHLDRWYIQCRAYNTLPGQRFDARNFDSGFHSLVFRVVTVRIQRLGSLPVDRARWLAPENLLEGSRRGTQALRICARTLTFGVRDHRERRDQRLLWRHGRESLVRLGDLGTPGGVGANENGHQSAEPSELPSCLGTPVLDAVDDP